MCRAETSRLSARREEWAPNIVAYMKYVIHWGLGSKIYFKGFSRNILSSILYKSSCL